MHFCPQCQATTPHRDPKPDRGTATCPWCGSENPIPQVPLLVVTGSSGCGKSTVLQALLGRRNPFIVVDSDFLCHDVRAFGSWDGFWNHVCIVSLTLARNLRPIVLVGRGLPSQIEKAATSAYFSAVHYLVLTCDATTQAARLRGRVAPGTPPPSRESIANAVKGTGVFLEEAGSRSHATVVDNSQQSLEETTAIVARWIRERIDRRSPGS